jgi:hypothetical protein
LSKLVTIAILGVLVLVGTTVIGVSGLAFANGGNGVNGGNGQGFRSSIDTQKKTVPLLKQ